MVTGVCGPTMTANVIGAPVPHASKEAPAKSDRRVSIYLRTFGGFAICRKFFKLPINCCSCCSEFLSGYLFN